MKDIIKNKIWFQARLLIAASTFLTLSLASGPVRADDLAQKNAAELAEIEKAVQAFSPDPRYAHDPFILITLQEAIAAKHEQSGGIGACLVRESTGEIVTRGHNRQFSPYFRSDLHAEMDLMNRYEDRIQALRTEGNPRRVEGLVLFSSVEPCPMCLTRIINFGVAKTYYAAPDPTGGMVHKMNDLPPFWKEAAEGRIYAEADCSPALKALAARLFAHGRRNIKTKQ
ncbi:MAG: nucleoside deaminase [Desulfobacteraceae bacterium]|nr:MAG: nucleoside deaminase [Desulfobacteraceae bacterium]